MESMEYGLVKNQGKERFTASREKGIHIVEMAIILCMTGAENV